MVRYDAVQGGPDPQPRGGKGKVVAFAVAALVVALAATVIGGLAKVMKTDPSPAQVSEALKGLMVSSGASPIKGFWIGRAGLSPEHHAPAQELHEMLAREQTLSKFTMLQQNEVKRSMACPLGNRCTFRGYARTEQKSTVVEYEKAQDDPTERVMKKKEESSGSNTMSLTVDFVIYETNITGCSADTIAWALNVSDTRSGNLEADGAATEPGQNQHEQVHHNRTDDHMMTQALQVYPFVIIQDRITGDFKDYIIDLKEDPRNADIKRSIAKDLNPVIDLQPNAQKRAKIGERGEILFRLMEHDMSGKHHNIYMLKRHAGGRGVHEVQHVRSFMLSQIVDDMPPDGTAEKKEKDPDEETCPYKLEDVKESAGQHSRTAKTEGDAVSGSKDEGTMTVGKEPPPQVITGFSLCLLLSLLALLVQKYKY
jgi:hypothetical protein